MAHALLLFVSSWYGFDLVRYKKSANAAMTQKNGSDEGGLVCEKMAAIKN